jgi:hypothetical protein
LKIHFFAGCQWLTPIILAAHEVEIRRIPVQSQPKQIIYETLLGQGWGRRADLHKKGLVENLKIQALS